MPNILFVVNTPSRWPLRVAGVELVSARNYLSDPKYSDMQHCRVYNLCRSYSYKSLGYYVSLLAEARGHKPLPTVATLQNLKYQSLVRVSSSDLDSVIQKSLAPLQGDRFTLSIYFAQNMAKRYSRLARQFFNLFPAPLLRAEFRKIRTKWTLQNLSPISANDIPDNHRPSVVRFATDYFTSRPAVVRPRTPRYHMAILAGSYEPTPPSDPRALERFAAAAKRLSIATEIIEKDDYGRLAEFDALFIRETTAVNHHTYRFARRAEAEGLVVVDDPTSILRCTNKVYLAELLARHRIPAPRTAILHENNPDQVLANLGLPCVLKQPDSSFSQGVVKVDSVEGFHGTVQDLLRDSDMLIAQEFLRTDFDWRIGIFDRKPLYACQYFMARNHWQIYNNAATDRKGFNFSGDFKTVPIELAPQKVVRVALKIANLIGDGLYGVDLKEIQGRFYVIEINDNPSIEAGVEDAVLRGLLYDRIMEVFLRRMERKHLATTH